MTAAAESSSRHHRREYGGGMIAEMATPEELFSAWLADADAQLGQDARAMTLATTAADGAPDARIVLLRYWRSGCLGFFGGGESAKGQALRHRPEAALVFFWPGLDRQVRIQGLVEELPDSVIDEYFASRPVENRLAAAMATQSAVLPEDGWQGLRQRYEDHLPEAAAVQRPVDWLGWQVRPRCWEFWLGQQSRLNQRLRFQRCSGSSSWQRHWLAP